MIVEPLPAAPRDEVAAYYDAKTESILRRFGPGPRVHYHTGMLEDMPPPGLTANALRVLIHESQEHLLHLLALAVGEPWEGLEVLDVGCGLGGGSLYWAAEYGASVTAITIASTHVPWVRRFAEMAGVADRVKAYMCDALEMPGHACFDRIVAVESSCYMPRRELFHRLHTLLRPGGVVALADCFAGRPELAEPFDRYWRTRIGSLEEYLLAARAEGLEVVLHEDTSERAVCFWALTMDLHVREWEARGDVPSANRNHIQLEHLRLLQSFMDGGLRHGVLVLRRPD